MYPVSERFRTAIASRHMRSVSRLVACLDDVELCDLPIESGGVTMDASRDVMRSLSATLGPSAAMDSQDILDVLSHPGVVVKAYRGLELPADPPVSAPFELGAYVYNTGLASLAAFEELTGRRMRYVHKFVGDTESCPVQVLAEFIAHGATPILTIEPNAYSLTQIAAGACDAYYSQIASAIATLGGTVVVRWGHEMNGDWYRWGAPGGVADPENTPALYVQAFQRVTGLLRAADNVLMMWCPNVYDVGDGDDYYPGDGYVDILAMDGYCFDNNAGETWGQWTPPSAIFGATYAALCALAPTKPIVIAETAARAKTRDKALYIHSLFWSMRAEFPRIRAVCWFQHPKPDDPENSWAVDQSAFSAAAWREETRLLERPVAAISVIGDTGTIDSAGSTWAAARGATESGKQSVRDDTLRPQAAYSAGWTDPYVASRGFAHFAVPPADNIRAAMVDVAWWYKGASGDSTYLVPSSIGSDPAAGDFSAFDVSRTYGPAWPVDTAWGYHSALVDHPAGAHFVVGLLAGHDFENSAPTSQYDFDEWYAGSSAYPPILRLTVELGANDAGVELVPLGHFIVDDADEGDDGTVTLEAADLSARTARNSLIEPYQIANGTELGTALAALLADRDPKLRLGFVAGDFPQEVPGVVFEAEEGSDPWAEARALAQAHGFALLIDGDGVAQLATVPDPAIAAPAVEYADDAMVIGQTRKTTFLETYNVVVAVGEGSWVTSPPSAIAEDDDPSSPTYVEGPMGRRPLRVSSPLILSADQATEAARTRLAQVKGRSSQATWTLVPNPAHEPHDIIAWRGELHMIDALMIPLSPSETMSATMRQTRRPW